MWIILSSIECESTWKLVKDFGSGNGYVPAGSEVSVIGVYPPGTPGVGMSDEDTVLASYARPDADPQTIAVPVSMFTTLCKAVS